MKKLILFAAIFGLGGLSFALLNMFLSAENKEVADTTPLSATSSVSRAPSQQEDTVPEEEVVENRVLITEDGSMLDGPFYILNDEGENTQATVRIIRSPEERLLQFANFNGDYSLASHIYFSSDLLATQFLNLGPAKLSNDVMIYGIPLDADLEKYKYILIYDTQLEEAEYSAKIR